MPEMSTLTMNNTTYEVVDSNHRNDKNNPHGITPEQIGAAPAGFGLGEETAAYVSDVHTINKIGFYRFDSATTNKPSHFPHGVISANIANGVIYLTATYAELQARSYYGDSGWSEWEYINALMAVGVEYRTTERWNNKVVYTKLVNVGALPNNAQKTINVGIDGSKWFEIHGHATDHHLSHGVAFPSSEIVGYIGNDGVLYLTTLGNFSSYDATVTIKYVKD